MKWEYKVLVYDLNTWLWAEIERELINMGEFEWEVVNMSVRDYFDGHEAVFLLKRAIS